MVASLASVSWRNSRCQGPAYLDVWFCSWQSLVMMRILCISKNWRRITPILVKLKILGWLSPITATKLDDGIAKMDGKLRKTKLISISKILVPFLYVPIHALMAVAYLPKLALVMLDGKILSKNKSERNSIEKVLGMDSLAGNVFLSADVFMDGAKMLWNAIVV